MESQLQPIKLAYDPTYNPSSGNLTFLSAFGPSNITFGELQYLISTRTRQSIVFGVCCGASIITFIIMWLVSQRKKTPVFILNQISLVLLFIQSALYFKYILSSQSSMTLVLTNFPQMVHKYNLHVSAAADIFKFLLVVTIECSLVFQVKVMFSGDSFKRVGYLLLSASIAIGLATSGTLLAAIIMIIRNLYTGAQNNVTKCYNIANILFASSINFMTFILMVKLFLAIRSRKFLGLRQFDSFHILLIMTCHSLVVPSILTILAYALHSDTDVLVSVSTLLVVLSLPLSSIWASSANTASTTRTLNVETNLTPTGFYPTSNDSFMTQSSKSSPETGTFSQSLINRFDPRNRRDKYDSEENLQYSSNTEISDEKQDVSDVADNVSCEVSSEMSSDNLKCKNPKLGKQTIDVSETMMNTSYNIYTPNTEDDVDARKFWLGDDKSLEK